MPAFYRTGFFYMASASAFFSCMTACVKLTGGRIPTAEIIFVRSLLAWPILWWLAVRDTQSIWPVDRTRVGLRFLTGTCGMFLNTYGMTKLPIADVNFLARTVPIWVAVMAPLLLNEAVGRATWFALIWAAVGVAMILKPEFAVGNQAGIALLIGALLAAMGHLLVRRLSATDKPSVVVFWFNTGTFVVSTPLTIQLFVLPAWYDAIAMVGVALLALFAQLLMTSAYRRGNAPSVASASYLGIVVSIVLGYAIWDEVLTVWGWLGGLSVVGAGVLLYKTRARDTGVYKPRSPIKTTSGLP